MPYTDPEQKWRGGACGGEKEVKNLPVVMRLRDTPVPIPNTKVKT